MEDAVIWLAEQLCIEIWVNLSISGFLILAFNKYFVNVSFS